jgi:hypothetical protein
VKISVELIGSQVVAVVLTEHQAPKEMVAVLLALMLVAVLLVLLTQVAVQAVAVELVTAQEMVVQVL